MRAFLAAVAIAALFGCGQSQRTPSGEPLPPAGSPRDDGSGLLARLSAPPLPTGAPALALDAGPPADASAGDASVPYADYRFEPKASYRPTPPPYADSYTAQAVERTGAIAGVVRGGRRGRGGCGGPVAVVQLADIERGRQFLGLSSTTLYQRRLQIGGLIEHRDCGLAPRLQIAAPIGAVLELVQTRAGRVKLVASRGDQTVAERELTGPGARASLLLDEPGPLQVRAGNHSAWVLVAEHPYYAVTDERGRFVLGDVPPGRYTLLVWHLRGNRPATTRRQVTVRANRNVSVQVGLR